MVDALVLYGYSNVNVKDTQLWQRSQMNDKKMLKMFVDCFNAIEHKDNDWLMNNMGMTSEWFIEHYCLSGNKDVLPILDLPIYIFQGALDGYCDIQGVHDIKDAFIKSGKTNLKVNILENHGHGLETNDSSNECLSYGQQLLINTIANINLC